MQNLSVNRTNMSMVLTVEPHQPIQSSPTIVSSQENSEEFNFESHINRLGDLLIEYDSWSDPLSENILFWAEETFSKVKDEAFEFNETTKNFLLKRIHKLLNKKLLSSFDKAPFKDQRISPLKNPILERDWTWEKEILEDYQTCWQIACQGLPLKSPFDKQEMKTIRSHELAKEIQKWAKDLLVEIEQSNDGTLVTNEIGCLALPLRQRNDDFQEAQMRLMNYWADARAANFRDAAHEFNNEMELGTKQIAQIKVETRERIAEAVRQTEELALARQDQIQKRIEGIEERYRESENDLNARIEQEVRRVEQIQAETQEEIAQAVARANERHQIRQDELQRQLENRVEDFSRREAVLRARIEQDEQQLEQTSLEAQQRIAQAIAQANERHQAHQSLQRHMEDIERNHLRTESTLNSRLAESERRIVQIQARSRQELAEAAARANEQLRTHQIQYQAKIQNMVNEHNRNNAALHASIANTQALLNSTKKQLSALQSTSAQQKNRINNLQGTVNLNAHKIRRLRKKAKKKKFGIF